MDAEQARELALNARLNHWPAHLGVKTDAERIEHLATKLDEAATRIASLETLEDEAEALREENDWYQLQSKGVPVLNEVAAKAPQALPETEEDMLLRKRAEYFHGSCGRSTALTDYEAGWLAAKAHYQPKQ
jgi:hypothetical protein